MGGFAVLSGKPDLGYDKQMTLSIGERVGRRPKVEIYDSCCPPQHIVAQAAAQVMACLVNHVDSRGRRVIAEGYRVTDEGGKVIVALPSAFATADHPSVRVRGQGGGYLRVIFASVKEDAVTERLAEAPAGSVKFEDDISEDKLTALWDSLEGSSDAVTWPGTVGLGVKSSLSSAARLPTSAAGSQMEAGSSTQVLQELVGEMRAQRMEMDQLRAMMKKEHLAPSGAPALAASAWEAVLPAPRTSRRARFAEETSDDEEFNLDAMDDEPPSGTRRGSFKNPARPSCSCPVFLRGWVGLVNASVTSCSRAKPLAPDHDMCSSSSGSGACAHNIWTLCRTAGVARVSQPIPKPRTSRGAADCRKTRVRLLAVRIIVARC